MAVQFWQDMSILEGDLEIAGHAKSGVLTAECAALDSTPLSAVGWTTIVPGLKTGTVEIEFMQDLTQGGVDDTLWSNFGAASVPRSFVTASADGSVAMLMRGIQLSYTPLTGDVGELAMGSVSSTVSNGPLVRGRLLHPSSVARTSSASGVARQLGEVIAGKSLYAALHVIAASGTSPTLAVKVQSDDNADFTTPTDRITFTTATAKGAQWSSVAGAITDDYWRVTYTIGGTSPSFAFAVTAGIV